MLVAVQIQFLNLQENKQKVKLITFHQKSSDLKIPVNSSININKLRKILKVNY